MSSSSSTNPTPSRERRRSYAYERRLSNELGASIRLDQLRKLQSQLGMLIQDARDNPLEGEDDDDMDQSIRSVGSSPASSRASSMRPSSRRGTGSAISPRSSLERVPSRRGTSGSSPGSSLVRNSGSSWERDSGSRVGTESGLVSGSGSSGWERDTSERSALLGNADSYDVEAGAPSPSMAMSYQPQRKSAPLQRNFRRPSNLGDDDGSSSLPMPSRRPSDVSEDSSVGLPLTHRMGGPQPQSSEATLKMTHRGRRTTPPSSSPPLVMMPAPSSPVNYSLAAVEPTSSVELTSRASHIESEISDESRTILSTDPTASLASDGNSKKRDDGNPSPSSTTGSRSRWRSRSRSFSRSLSRRRDGTRPSASPSRRKRSSIFKSKNKDSETSGNGTNIRSMLDQSFRRAPNYDFLQKENEEKEGGSLQAGGKWWHGVFFFSIISMLACIVTLWAPYPIGARMPSEKIAEMPWSDGCQGLDSCICPRETICADDLLSMIFLTIARSTAWFDYPLYMLLFLSKANNLNNFLQKTALRCWINFSDYHRVHSLFGIIVGIESASHSFFHLLRWARRQDDIKLLWTSQTGITGLIAITLCPLIVLPMTVPYLKQRMPFEWRKGLHYLSVIWGAALMCHAPERIFWLIGIPVFVYTADKMAEGLFKTHLLESAHFQRLGDTSCMISFANPPGFGKQNSAYVYLMLPWLSKYQFHAFTVFPSIEADHSSICIHKCGDWTEKLMKTISTPTHKPAFVVGPFLSPFSSPAMDSENLVAVASGIGVTPAISLIKQYSSTSRRLNLVWVCRDAGLIEHFLQNVEFGSDGYTLIYYTGKERSLILRDNLPPNIFVLNGRPNLERTIGGIIASIATGEGLPEELHKKVITRTPAEMRSKLLLEKALSIYTMDQLYEYTVKASNHYSNGLEPLVAEVNYQGVLSTMRHLLGDDCEHVMDQITHSFEEVDADGDCRLVRDEFEIFFEGMLRGSTGTGDDDEESSMTLAKVNRGLQRMSTCRDMFESGRRVEGADGKSKDEFGIRGHLQGDGKFASKNWNMLYCGGSQPVLDQLKAFKRKFGIGLSVEKFDW